MKSFLIFFFFFIVLKFSVQPKIANAASLNVEVQVSNSEVEVAEPFQIQLNIQLDPTTPLSANLDFDFDPPKGILIHSGPMSSKRKLTVNGMTTLTIGSTWILVAQKQGSFILPSPILKSGGHFYSGNSTKIKVIPSTGKKKNLNPFAMGGLGGSGFSFQMGNPFEIPFQEEREPEISKDLSLEAAPDPYIFLRATVDKKSAIVGEQIKLTVYEYSRTRYKVTDYHEAPLKDFVRIPLSKDPGVEDRLAAQAGEEIYRVRILGNFALFPIHSGELHTGVFKSVFNGVKIGNRAERMTEDLVVRVNEPPQNGRPPHYQLGSVGVFDLKSEVSNRTIRDDGATTVALTISGKGNFPEMLSIPKTMGVTWLDPQKKDTIEVQHDLVQGSRSFIYVVQPKQSGSFDLGKIDFPFFDPVSQSYRIATTELGIVDVIASGNKTIVTEETKTSSSGQDDLQELASLPKSSDWVLDPGRSRLQNFFMSPLFLFLFVGSPVFVWFFQERKLFSNVSKKFFLTSKKSLAQQLKEKLKEAKKEQLRNNLKASLAALEESIYLSIEGKVHFNPRGFPLEKIGQSFRELGEFDSFMKISKLIEQIHYFQFASKPTSENLDTLFHDVEIFCSTWIKG